MKNRQWRFDDALTGLEIVILLAVIAAGVVALLLLAGGHDTASWSRTFPGGLVAESMYMSGDNLQLRGEATGFAAVTPGSAPVPVLYQYPDAGRLGALGLTVSLFIGDTGAIDMDRLNVTLCTKDSCEPIQKNDRIPLVCPNWTITGKYNIMPGHTADTDNWLEPREQFALFVCPSTPLEPYQSFTVGLFPDGVAAPLRITRTVPPAVRPVMILG